MGVVNVTPDSFFEGSRFADPERAIERGRLLARAGASILDIGGESTRPGAQPVGTVEEVERVLPVVVGLAGGQAAVSIDTSKALVADAALRSGATMVNDVTALRDPEMAAVCSAHRATVVLMHMRGDPSTMQGNPRYDDIVDDVKAFLEARVEAALAAGISEQRIWVDPGIGFGKRNPEDNLELLRRLPELKVLGRPILVGTSRKSFIGAIDGSAPADRLGGSVASALIASLAGADVLRVHDVAEVSQAIAVAAAILDQQEGAGSLRVADRVPRAELTARRLHRS